MILTTLALLAAHPALARQWTPFDDHLISNQYALDVCAERDDPDACMAAEHRRIICEGVLLAQVGRDDALGLTCRHVLCEANGDDGLTDSLREHGYCAPRPRSLRMRR